MTNTTTRDLRAILADLADFTVASTGTRAITLYHELEDAVRAALTPVRGGTDALAAQAERNARTMAPPVPGVTRNAGYTVRAVIHAHDAERGLLAAWWVAGEDPERGAWVTWNAYELDGSRAGRLSYDAGHYFTTMDPEVNKRRALADLAVRAGLMSTIALRIADEITQHEERAPDPAPPAARRAASYLRRRYER